MQQYDIEILFVKIQLNPTKYFQSSKPNLRLLIKPIPYHMFKEGVLNDSTQRTILAPSSILSSRLRTSTITSISVIALIRDKYEQSTRHKTHTLSLNFHVRPTPLTHQLLPQYQAN